MINATQDQAVGLAKGIGNKLSGRNRAVPPSQTDMGMATPPQVLPPEGQPLTPPTKAAQTIMTPPIMEKPPTRFARQAPPTRRARW